MEVNQLNNIEWAFLNYFWLGCLKLLFYLTYEIFVSRISSFNSSCQRLPVMRNLVLNHIFVLALGYSFCVCTERGSGNSLEDCHLWIKQAD